MEVISTNDGSYFYLTENTNDNNLIKGAVSRNSAKLGNYKMPVKLGET